LIIKSIGQASPIEENLPRKFRRSVRETLVHNAASPDRRRPRPLFFHGSASPFLRRLWPVVVLGKNQAGPAAVPIKGSRLLHNPFRLGLVLLVGEPENPRGSGPAWSFIVSIVFASSGISPCFQTSFRIVIRWVHQISFLSAHLLFSNNLAYLRWVAV